MKFFSLLKRSLQWFFPATHVRSSRMHDLLLFFCVFAMALAVSIPLSTLFDDNNPFSMAVFILVVALIARYTDGYLYGVAASILSVLCVNYIFTYPYWAFNMSLMGYPLNFAAMLIVSLIISTLTTQNKRQAQLQLEIEKEKTRANLLQAVSHDIRTPLTSIIGSSSVLLEHEQLPAEERHELLSSIHRDAQWLSRLTENILSITKVSSEHVTLKKDTEVLEEIMGSAITKFRKLHPEIEITVHKPEEILLVPMDATLIEQVILNLMDNAAIHGGHTSRISLQVEQLPYAVRISISDNGGGFSEESIPHLFDGSAPPGSHSDAKRSMGIGLSVCRTIIKAHGGGIHACNTPSGASVFFTLPVQEE
ncbi:MAG: DUF4118 domain-containing protein [Clostridia bacterium]|nr:DUF4118 domain-containing protein [Clostridia bacterium]